jgi:hypothetical protein
VAELLNKDIFNSWLLMMELHINPYTFTETQTPFKNSP